MNKDRDEPEGWLTCFYWEETGPTVLTFLVDDGYGARKFFRFLDRCALLAVGDTLSMPLNSPMMRQASEFYHKKLGLFYGDSTAVDIVDIRVTIVPPAPDQGFTREVFLTKAWQEAGLEPDSVDDFIFFLRDYSILEPVVRRKRGKVLEERGAVCRFFPGPGCFFYTEDIERFSALPHHVKTIPLLRRFLSTVCQRDFLVLCDGKYLDIHISSVRIPDLWQHVYERIIKSKIHHIMVVNTDMGGSDSLMWRHFPNDHRAVPSIIHWRPGFIMDDQPYEEWWTLDRYIQFLELVFREEKLS